MYTDAVHSTLRTPLSATFPIVCHRERTEVATSWRAARPCASAYRGCSCRRTTDSGRELCVVRCSTSRGAVRRTRRPIVCACGTWTNCCPSRRWPAAVTEVVKCPTVGGPNAELYGQPNTSSASNQKGGPKDENSNVKPESKQINVLNSDFHFSYTSIKIADSGY